MSLTTLTLARQAMATRFELVLCGERPAALQAAGEEALDEIERLESLLSLYRPGSAVAQLNARAHAEPVRVTPELFVLLEHAQRLHAESEGALDVTIGPLMRCWGFLGGSGAWPATAAIAEARSRVGMELIALHRADFTVQFRRAGVLLDLGAIGKGYAIQQAMELLREAGVTRALLHGGTSTVAALGTPPDADAWKIGIELPDAGKAATQFSPGGQLPTVGDPPENPLAVVALRDEALSVSAVQGKCFVRAGRTYGHVLDPRTGFPTSQAVLAAVVLPSATEADALSTALLTNGLAGLDRLAANRSGLRALVVEATADNGPLRWRSRGINPTAGTKVVAAGAENRN